MDKNELKNEAQYIWNRLDDLASTDPKAYKSFIEQQMKEREIYMSAPEPKLCISTTSIEKKEKVYINICGWRRIPAPANDTEALKLMTGIKSFLPGSGKRQLCIPVAVNDKTLDEVLKNNFDKDMLISLVLDLITEHAKIPVSKSYKIEKDIYCGNFPANPRALFVRNPESEFFGLDMNSASGKMPSTEEILASPDALLKNLSMDETSDENLLSNNTASNNDNLLDKLINPHSTKTDASKKLIQEIVAEPQSPEHSLITNSGNLILKIHLPLVERISDCDLDIFEDKVKLFVDGKYEFELKLPCAIDDNETSAKFNRKTSNLTITMPKCYS